MTDPLAPADPAAARQARLYRATVTLVTLTALLWIGSGITGSGAARAASVVFGLAGVATGVLWLARSVRSRR